VAASLQAVTSIPAPPLPLSQVGRSAHDIGLAGLLGGNLFGRLALHPSVAQISDKAERGRLVERGMAPVRNGQLAVAAGVGWRVARRAP
jgi:hypothetical protein